MMDEMVKDEYIEDVAKEYNFYYREARHLYKTGEQSLAMEYDRYCGLLHSTMRTLGLLRRFDEYRVEMGCI